MNDFLEEDELASQQSKADARQSLESQASYLGRQSLPASDSDYFVNAPNGTGSQVQPRASGDGGSGGEVQPVSSIVRASRAVSDSGSLLQAPGSGDGSGQAQSAPPVAGAPGAGQSGAGQGGGAVAPEPGHDFEMVRKYAHRMGGNVLLHVPEPQEPRGFLENTLGSRDSPASGRLLTRLGQGLLGDTNAGTPALIAGQAGYNYDAVGIGANLVGGTNNVAKAMGAFTPTMMRDVLRGFAVHAQLAGRQAVQDSGEQATDVAMPQREEYARHAQLFREVSERKRDGETVPKNMQGRELVHTARAAQALGREIDYMGHRSEYEYTMQESAGLNNRDAIREKRPVPRAGELDPQGPAESDREYAARLDEWKALNKGAVRFVPRADGSQMPVSTDGEFSVEPAYQTDREYAKGKFVQGFATATTRAVDEFGRILQNEEAGIDDLRKGNNKRAALKAALHSARGVGVGIGSAMSGDPTGMIAYPLIDAAARIGGAGVSAIGQTLGHVTGLEAGAQRQDDIDLHNTHYFGEAKQIRAANPEVAAPNPGQAAAGAAGAAPLDESKMDLVDDAQEARDRMVDPQPTARAQAVLERGLRFRESADEIGSERAGLPQLNTGNVATSFMGQRLGRGGFNHWLRDATTEPRIAGTIVWPLLKALGRGTAAIGRGIGRGVMGALRGIGNGFNRVFRPERYKRQMAARRERQLAPLREAGLIADAPALAAGDPAAGDPSAPLSMADQLAPVQQNEGTGLEQQMEAVEEKSEDGSSQRGSQGSASARNATQLLDEGEAVGLDPKDQEAAEDQALRDKLRAGGERTFRGRMLRDYIAGEVLGFGKRDIAGENIRAWHRHFKDRDLRIGQREHQKARTLDPEGYKRAKALERDRILARLKAMPGMAAQMDREEAVRSGENLRRRAVDLGAGPVVGDGNALQDGNALPVSILQDGKDLDAAQQRASVGSDSASSDEGLDIKSIGDRNPGAADGASGPAGDLELPNAPAPVRRRSAPVGRGPDLGDVSSAAGSSEAKVPDIDEKTVSAVSRSSRGGVDPAVDEETKSAQSLRSSVSGGSESEIESQGTVDAAPLGGTIKAEDDVIQVGSDLDDGEDDVIRVRDDWDDDEDEVIRLGSDLDDDIPSQGTGDAAASSRELIQDERKTLADGDGPLLADGSSGGVIPGGGSNEAKVPDIDEKSVSASSRSSQADIPSQGTVVGAPGSQGLIEEERKTLAGGDGAPQPGVGALLGAGAALGPRTEYSQEPDRSFRPEDWRTGRSNRVVGKFGRTFGERRAAIGGGAGGFFGALFGRGMARANRLAEQRNYRQAQKAEGARLREEQKERLITAHGSLDWRPQGIMRSQLANAGQIEHLRDFPREPGVAYDQAAARSAHGGFMDLRRRFMNTGNGAGARGVNTGQILFGVQPADQGESELTTTIEDMRTAYDGYDRQVRNKTLYDAGGAPKIPGPDGKLYDSLDPKFRALMRANQRWGQDMAQEEANPHQPRPRLRNAAGAEKRVRFMDGADDAVGLPTNDPAADITNKPMPTGVRFHPAPIGKRTFARELNASLARLAASPEYVQANPGERKQQVTNLATSAEERKKDYYRNEAAGLDTPNVGALSDAEAMKQEAYAYPIRARLQRTSDGGLRTMYGERQQALAAGQPVDDKAVGDPDILNHVIMDRIEDSDARESKRNRRAIPVAGLSPQMQLEASQQLSQAGLRGIDAKLPLSDQYDLLPHGLFDKFLTQGKQIGRQRAQAVVQRPQSAPKDDDMDSMAGEGSLLEEELKEV